MAWPFYDKTGPEWKYGWKTRTINTLSLPPPQLLGIFAILIFFLSISSYVEYKQLEQRAEVGLHVFLVLMAVTLLFVVRYVLWDGWARFWPSSWRDKYGRRYIPTSRCKIPWGVGLMVVLLLVMMSYQSYFHSKWFRPVWWSE
ncbi:transmembrane protein [Rhynchospora pubera]|uniref:Transmembrane protein n=1 Tax=Rhynchospora pubera TaxID=906938 RepID=A0AAV8GIU2_9POAL|nr:transmembrane protein [Rhynchospora pubera]KAJ4805595.1 transmembrane protein [Rhynchospora pubera]